MEEPLIAVRIRDGIFVGNATAAYDDDFMTTNKISHVVNCAGAEVQDMYARAGIAYLTFHWKDIAAKQGLNTASGVMFDPSDLNIDQTVRFIDKGTADGECVLVHDVHGTSRSCALVAAYFIVKYGWRLDNALAFMQMAHQEMEIAPHWARQLHAFAKRREADIDVFDPSVDDSRFALDSEQWMLRNTLLNGLTANIQDGNALYQQCAREVPPLEATAKAQQRKSSRRRIVFTDTNQGTSVDSFTTIPVVNASALRQLHRDPTGGIEPLGGPSYLGGKGVGAILSARRNPQLAAAIVDSIVARRSPINTRRLESGPLDGNAKGKQQLYRRLASQPHLGTHAIGGGGAAAAEMGSSNSNNIPYGGGGGSSSNDVLQRANNNTVRQQQQQPAEMVQRYPTPAASSSSSSSLQQQQGASAAVDRGGAMTPLRPPTAVVQRQASNTVSHSLSNTTPLQGRPSSPQVRPRESGSGGNNTNTNNNNTTPLRAASAALTLTPAKQPLKSASGAIRNPFSIGSGGLAPRKGSPLPRQAQHGVGSGAAALASANASSSLSSSPAAVRREVVSSGYGQPRAVAGSRPSSPAPPQQQGAPHSSSSSARFGSSSSPFVRGTTANGSRPQSPTTQQSQQQRMVFTSSGGTSSSRLAGSTTPTGAGAGVIRRAMSPRPNVSSGGVGGGGGLNASSSITSYAGSSAIQSHQQQGSVGGYGSNSAAAANAIRRANSPTARTLTRIGSAASALSPSAAAANANAHMSAYSTVGNSARQSSPMQRQSSPMQMQRPSSPSGGGGGAAGVRPNSPSRRPSLADQYLASASASAGSGSAGGGVARGSIVSQQGGLAPSSSTIARRNSPMPATRRY